MEKIVIYTDGGCRGNPGIGGWGVWLRYKDIDKKLKGAELNTTNNKMELTASIRALQTLKSNDITVDLYTDSKYVIQGINEWIDGWKAKGWKTANKKPVKNKELWQILDKLSCQHKIDWKWIRGHTGHLGNETADQLANQAIDEL